MGTNSQDISFTLLNEQKQPLVYLGNAVNLTLTVKNAGSTPIPVTKKTSLVLLFKRPLIHGQFLVGEGTHPKSLVNRFEEENLWQEGWSVTSIKFTSSNPENENSYQIGYYNEIVPDADNELRITFTPAEFDDWKNDYPLTFTFGPAQGIGEEPIFGEVSLLLYDGETVVAQQTQKFDATYYTE